MTEGWHLPDDDVPLTGEQAAALIQQRLDRGLLETWLEHDRGLLLALVSNEGWTWDAVWPPEKKTGLPIAPKA